MPLIGNAGKIARGLDRRNLGRAQFGDAVDLDIGRRVPVPLASPRRIMLRLPAAAAKSEDRAWI